MRVVAFFTVATCVGVGCLFPSLDTLTSGDAATAVDAKTDADAAPRCDPSKPFATPVPIPGSVNTTDDEVTPRFSTDELTVLFSRRSSDAGSDDFDLYMATRASTNDVFGDATPITELNSSFGDFDPFLLSDNRTLYFASERPNGDAQKIFVATRASPTAPFDAPIDVGALDLAATFVGQPYFVPETTAYVADTDKGGIFTATAQNGTFTAPVLVAGLPATGVGFPSLTGDALTMFVGVFGASDDVYVATRASTSDAFGALAPVTELNTSFDDDPTWVSADGCVIVVMSNRISSEGYDMFFAQRGQ